MKLMGLTLSLFAVTACSYEVGPSTPLVRGSDYNIGGTSTVVPSESTELGQLLSAAIAPVSEPSGAAFVETSAPVKTPVAKSIENPDDLIVFKFTRSKGVSNPDAFRSDCMTENGLNTMSFNQAVKGKGFGKPAEVTVTYKRTSGSSSQFNSFRSCLEKASQMKSIITA